MQTIVIYLCILYITLFWGLSIFDKYIKYTSFQRISMYVLLVVAFGTLAFTWQPATNDLTRQFQYLDQIRNNNGSIIDFLRYPDVGGAQYSSLYAYNIYRYFIAKLFSCDSMFPLITVVIVYCIFSYILFDYRKEYIFQGMNPAICISICLGCMPFLYVASGVRNSLAASTMALAVYKYLYQQKSVICFIIIALIAALIHPVTLIAIPFAFMSKGNFGWKGILLLFCILSILSNLMRHFTLYNVKYFRLIGTYYSSYTSNTQYVSAKYYLYFDILVLLVIISSYVICKKNIEGTPKYRLYYFLLLYSVAVIAFVGNYDMVLRPCYFLGAFAAVPGTLIDDKRIWPQKWYWFRRLVIIVIVVSAIYVFVRYMHFFYAWSYNQL